VGGGSQYRVPFDRIHHLKQDLCAQAHVSLVGMRGVWHFAVIDFQIGYTV
jgi:hypothetical protein